ncbi:hypothetical protein [Lysinibacillus xylanilyticus]
MFYVSKAKRQVQMFYVSKAKRQVQMFYVAVAAAAFSHKKHQQA